MNTLCALLTLLSLGATTLAAEPDTSGVPLHRELQVDRPHLHLPVTNGAPKRIMRLWVDDRLQREFEIELAEGEPDFWMDTDVTPYRGRTLRIEADGMRGDSTALAALRLADGPPGGDQLYHESLRPQFHFSPARAGRTTRMVWCFTKASIICSSNTIRMAFSGAT